MIQLNKHTFSEGLCSDNPKFCFIGKPTSIYLFSCEVNAPQWLVTICFAPGVHPPVSFHLERIYLLVICLLCNVTQNIVNRNNWEIEFIWGSIVDMS